MFALAAIPGSLLVARMGPFRTLAVGLLVTAVAATLRGASGTMVLYAATIAMSAGIAVMQPALPTIVREWMPERVGFGAALYSNGLLVGELLVVWLTVPFVLPLTSGRWGLALAASALPVFVAFFLVAGWFRKREPPKGSIVRPEWRPNWRDPLVWQLGFIFGGINTIYLGTNFFLPDYLAHTNRVGLAVKCLTALNLCQLPASLLLLPVTGRLSRLRTPYVACGVLLMVALAGLAYAPGQWVVPVSGFLGFLTASLLILTFALPPALARREEVHLLSAGMFTISYACSVVVPILTGMLWDLTGVPSSAFLLLGLCALLIAALSCSLKLGGASGRPG